MVRRRACPEGGNRHATEYGQTSLVRRGIARPVPPRDQPVPVDHPRGGSGARSANQAERPGGARQAGASATSRSEEHTSGLQSRSDLVCRLLLEKKKKERK